VSGARTRLFRLAALAIALGGAMVVGLVGVEIWVRARWDPYRGAPGFYASDPVRGETLGHDYMGWFAGVPMALNHLGFRDSREYDLAKAPGTFRIIVLGDSVAFGHGSIEDLTYPRLLETILATRHPGTNWQVWNLGVPGYNTSTELSHLLEVGPRFQPDLVIVGFAVNDVMTNLEPRTPTRVQRLASAVSNALRPRVYSLELYRRLYLQWANEAPPPVDPLLIRDERSDHSGDQRLLPLHPISDGEFDRTRCASFPVQPTADPEQDDQMLRSAAASDPGLGNWKRAVRRFQDLHRSGAYRVAFFVDLMPALCVGGAEDYFDPRRTRELNAYFLKVMGDGTPAVGPHDALARYHPSELPTDGGHALGSTNLVKAEVLADFLEREGLLAPAVPAPALAPAGR